MLDKRKSARNLTLRTAKVLVRSPPCSIDCAVLDISQSGACILVPNDVEMPEAFVLQIDHDSQARSCKIAWRNGCRIGLMFEGCE